MAGRKGRAVSRATHVATRARVTRDTWREAMHLPLEDWSDYLRWEAHDLVMLVAHDLA